MARARLALLLLALATAAGCSLGGDESATSTSPAEDTAATAPGPEGLTRYKVGRGVIGVPSGWRTVTPGHELSEPELAGIRATEPALLPVIEAAGNPGSQVKLFAFGPSDTPADFATNLLVLAQSSGDLTRRDFYAGREADARTFLLATSIESSEVELEAGKALRLRYRHSVSHLTREIAEVQYAFLGDGTAYVLTYSALPQEVEDWLPTFDASARSFRLG